MSLFKNIHQVLSERQIHNERTIAFERSAQVTPDLVCRIGLEAELTGHNGCVNCLEWNEQGTLLASGSDDVQIQIWDPFRHKSLHQIRTGHTGNIFSVKFLPNSNDSMIVSGAADCRIRVHDINAQEATQTFSCHVGRVKRLATAPNVPFMFWSAAEDGTIMQFDLRCPELATTGNPNNVLINLNAHIGHAAEAKCLSINPQQPHLLAVGANDPYVRVYDRRALSTTGIKFPTDGHARLYQWEHPRLDPEAMNQEQYSLPQGCVSYFIAGHLPQKLSDYRKKYRTLAATYVTFSPCGRELLVNLGGEQIYLFDVNGARRPQRLPVSTTTAVHSNGVVREAAACNPHGNGLTHCNGTTNGVSKQLSSAAAATEKTQPEKRHRKKLKHGRPLPPTVDAIKQRANAVFEKQQYHQAILLYNQAIAMVPDSPILYGNRAAAYMKRNWDGDHYAALQDCYAAIRLDSEHLKAHFRMAKCLFELSWTREALDCLQLFKAKFPDYTTSSACQTLDRDIKAAIYSRTDSSADKSPPGERGGRGDAPSGLSDQEKVWREEARDYKQRFCGHCNTTTDIKEANFFGSNGQYIVAGSDDGSFFVWEKQTTNIVRVLKGDDSIVNCLQPHPGTCLLATSGIDPVVRLWSPRPEDGQKEEREVDNSDDAAAANQRRMNADPLEVMLMNMGYRITAAGGGGMDDGEDGDDRSSGDGGEGAVQCRPS